MYKIARQIAKHLAPLVGITRTLCKKVKTFVDSLKSESGEEDEEPCDVMVLFTSVPVDNAIVMIRERLEKNSMLKEKTLLKPMDVVNLLERCLRCTYFVF